jgi:hypothetical protein
MKPYFIIPLSIACGTHTTRNVAFIFHQDLCPNMLNQGDMCYHRGVMCDPPLLRHVAPLGNYVHQDHSPFPNSCILKPPWFYLLGLQDT